MELQQRSSRRSKHSSRRPERSASGWTPIQIARVAGFAIVAAAPWYYGSAPWIAQYWMVWIALLVGVLLSIEYLRRFWANLETDSLAIPSLSYLALGIAAFAWFQAIPAFTIDGKGGWAPASVEIQRWFLGVPNDKLDARFFGAISPNDNPVVSDDAHNLLTAYPDAGLALSIEPLHTRAAIGSLATIAVMIWLGSVAFRTENWRLAFLIFLTLLGVVIGLFGLASAISWEKINWLGLDGSLSFATFVSKNTAGGFLNVCLAASIGLSAWAFMKPRQSDQRYAYDSDGPATRMLSSFEEIFAQITTAQIATLLATTFLLTCVVCTGSRGACISGIVACLVALLIGSTKKNGYGGWIFACFVIALGLSVIFFLEFDQRVSEGFLKLIRVEAFESDLKGGRTYIWGVALKAFLYFGIIGSGLGTFHFASLPFQNPANDGWYYHAESLYAQALVELGWMGVGAIIAVLVIAIRLVQSLKFVPAKTFSRSRSTSGNYMPIYLAGLTLVISQTIHSCIDFALIVPAVFLPFALLLGIVGGAASQKRLDEEKSVAPPSNDLKRSQRVSRLPEIDRTLLPGWGEERQSGERPAVQAQVQGEAQAWSKRNTAHLIGCTLACLFLLSSLIPLDAMSRVEKMELWLRDQEKVSRAARGGSPSDYLAGLWGRPMISISRVPSALRMIGESVLYQFRTERLDAIEAEQKNKTVIPWEITSPLIIRSAIAKKDLELSSISAGTKSFEQSSDFLTLMGGNEQVARWDKARELIERAHLQSPLDWRLVWGRLLLDRRLSVREWNGWFDRTVLLSQHRSETNFQVGVLGREAAKDTDHVNKVWEKAMQKSYLIAPRVAALIALDTPDEEVPLEIFPKLPLSNYTLAGDPFTKTRFPITHDRIWVRIEEEALSMDSADSNRFSWLARAAAYFGKPEKELEFLEQFVVRNPTDLQWRLLWADRLAASGDLESAMEQALLCQSLRQDDPQAEALIKRLRSQSSSASTVKIMK